MLGGDAFVGTRGLGAEDDPIWGALGVDDCDPSRHTLALLVGDVDAAGEGDPDVIDSLCYLSTHPGEPLAKGGGEGDPNLLAGGPGSSPPLWTGGGQPTDVQEEFSGVSLPSKTDSAGPDQFEMDVLLGNLDFLLMNPGGGGTDSAERPPPPPVTTPEGGTTPENDAEPQNGGSSIHDVGNSGPEQTRKRSNQSSGASSRNKRRRGCDQRDPREYYNNPISSIERLKDRTNEARENAIEARDKAEKASERAERAKVYAHQLKMKAALVECHAKQLGQRASQMAVESPRGFWVPP